MALELCPPWASAPAAWAEITTGDALFRHLLAVGHSWEIASDAAWLDGDTSGRSSLPQVAHWWKGSHVDVLAGREREDALRRWMVLVQMLWCFDEARRSERLTPSEIDRAYLAKRLRVFTGNPGLRSMDVARAYMWIRSFRATEPSVRTDVPIALYDTEARRGFLATLTLELLPGGVGEVADHPGSAFDTIHHERFMDSIGHAWKMARDATPDASMMDGRWRVRRGAPFVTTPSRGLRLVDGPSASGAAARGWWHVLHARIPDAEVVVLAQVAPDGRSLDPVDHVAPKVDAILREGVTPDGHPAFDTIVVVGDDARRQAEEVLGGNAVVRVVQLH